jgi:hypothetical protein
VNEQHSADADDKRSSEGKMTQEESKGLGEGLLGGMEVNREFI